MERVVTPEAMARADQRTIDAGTRASVLMHRAGRSVAWETRRVAGGSYGKRAVVVCGKGNNGGDGLITADALTRWGTRPFVVELASGVDRPALSRALGRADVVVDAMYGTGFRGALEGDAAWCADEIRGRGIPVVAVDIPSGIDGLTGAVHGAAVQATSTVTFGARKTGLVFEPGRAHAGQVTVADIGIDVAGDDDNAALTMFEAADVAAALPPRRPDAHKWMAGVLVVGGSDGLTGAPLFVSHAAMRAGAGIVWCGLPGEEAARDASGTEVVTRALPVTPAGVLAPEARDAVLAVLSRFKSLALGPGLGTDPAIRSTVFALVAEARIPMVLDADGLNALNGELRQLRGRETLGAPTVLTPHDAEYARLAGEPVGDDRIAAARRLAERSACVVLLKGPGTVVADPGGRVVLNPTGNAALATAGSGDALTGIVAAFLARDVPAFDAAACAAWVHGRTAERVTEHTGTSGAIAADLVAELAPTLLSLETPCEEETQWRRGRMPGTPQRSRPGEEETQWRRGRMPGTPQRSRPGEEETQWRRGRMPGTPQRSRPGEEETQWRRGRMPGTPQRSRPGEEETQ